MAGETGEISSIGVKLTLEAGEFMTGLGNAESRMNTLQEQAKQAGSGAGQVAGGGSSPSRSSAAQGSTNVSVNLTVSKAAIKELRTQITSGLGAIPVTIDPVLSKEGMASIKTMLGSVVADMYGTSQQTSEERVTRSVRKGPQRREYGGPVTSGQPYIVGEKRPEVFIPRQSGYVLPNADQYRRREMENARRESQRWNDHQRNLNSYMHRMAGGPVEPQGPLQRRLAGLAPLEPQRQPAPPPQPVEPEWMRRASERRLPPKVYRMAGGPVEGYRLQQVPRRGGIHLQAYPTSGVMSEYNVGMYDFNDTANGGLEPAYAHTSPLHRRIGLATWAYEEAERRTGRTLSPPSRHSRLAEKLWSQPNRPFGKRMGGGPARPSRSLEARALRMFGETDELSEAGYITPSGRYLDFSGRHQAGGYRREGTRFVPEGRRSGRDYLAGQRNVDHREVAPLFPGRSRRYDAEAMEWMQGRGYARLMPLGGNELNIDIQKPLTEAQIRRLSEEAPYLSHARVEVYRPGGSLPGFLRETEWPVDPMGGRRLPRFMREANEFLAKPKRRMGGGPARLPGPDLNLDPNIWPEGFGANTHRISVADLYGMISPRMKAGAKRNSEFGYGDEYMDVLRESLLTKGQNNPIDIRMVSDAEGNEHPTIHDGHHRIITSRGEPRIKALHATISRGAMYGKPFLAPEDIGLKRRMAGGPAEGDWRREYAERAAARERKFAEQEARDPGSTTGGGAYGRWKAQAFQYGESELPDEMWEAEYHRWYGPGSTEESRASAPSGPTRPRAERPDYRVGSPMRPQTDTQIDKLKAMAGQETQSPNEAAIARRMLRERGVPGYHRGGQAMAGRRRSRGGWAEQDRDSSRFVHVTNRRNWRGIVENGLDYSREGSLLGTARPWGPGEPAFPDDPRFSEGLGQVSMAFDIPNAEWRKYTSPFRQDNPGKLPPEFYRGMVRGGRRAMAGRVDVSAIEPNFRKYFEAATPEQFTEGAHWYQAWGKELRDNAGRLGIAPEILTSVAAQLSPRNSWPGNFHDAIRYAEAWQQGLSMPKASTYATNQEKAWKLLQDEMSGIVGPKINPFAAALLSNDEKARKSRPQDLWMKRAAVDDLALPDNKGTPSPRQRREMDRVVDLLADEYSMDPRQIQAIIWTTAREQGMELRGSKKHSRMRAEGGHVLESFKEMSPYIAQGKRPGESWFDNILGQAPFIIQKYLAKKLGHAQTGLLDIETIRPALQSQVEDTVWGMLDEFPLMGTALNRVEVSEKAGRWARYLPKTKTIQLNQADFGARDLDYWTTTLNSHGEIHDPNLLKQFRPGTANAAGIVRHEGFHALAEGMRNFGLAQGISNEPGGNFYELLRELGLAGDVGDISPYALRQRETNKLLLKLKPDEIGAAANALGEEPWAELATALRQPGANLAGIPGRYRAQAEQLLRMAAHRRRGGSAWRGDFGILGMSRPAMDVVGPPISPRMVAPRNIFNQIGPEGNAAEYWRTLMDPKTADWERFDALSSFSKRRIREPQPHAKGGPGDLEGLYVVGEVGPELFVPDRLKHLVPEDVLSQIPRAKDGIQVIGQKPYSLFAPSENGTIIPNRLMDRVPHAKEGVRTDPQFDTIENDLSYEERALLQDLGKLMAANGIPVGGPFTPENIGKLPSTVGREFGSKVGKVSNEQKTLGKKQLEYLSQIVAAAPQGKAPEVPANQTVAARYMPESPSAPSKSEFGYHQQWPSGSAKGMPAEPPPGWFVAGSPEEQAHLSVIQTEADRGRTQEAVSPPPAATPPPVEVPPEIVRFPVAATARKAAAPLKRGRGRPDKMSTTTSGSEVVDAVAKALADEFLAKADDRDWLGTNMSAGAMRQWQGEGALPMGEMNASQHRKFEAVEQHLMQVAGAVVRGEAIPGRSVAATRVAESLGIDPKNPRLSPDVIARLQANPEALKAVTSATPEVAETKAAKRGRDEVYTATSGDEAVDARAKELLAHLTSRPDYAGSDLTKAIKRGRGPFDPDYDAHRKQSWGGLEQVLLGQARKSLAGEPMDEPYDSFVPEKDKLEAEWQANDTTAGLNVDPPVAEAGPAPEVDPSSFAAKRAAYVQAIADLKADKIPNDPETGKPLMTVGGAGMTLAYLRKGMRELKPDEPPAFVPPVTEATPSVDPAVAAHVEKFKANGGLVTDVAGNRISGAAGGGGTPPPIEPPVMEATPEEPQGPTTDDLKAENAAVYAAREAAGLSGAGMKGDKRRRKPAGDAFVAGGGTPPPGGADPGGGSIRVFVTNWPANLTSGGGRGGGRPPAGDAFIATPPPASEPPMADLEAEGGEEAAGEEKPLRRKKRKDRGTGTEFEYDVHTAEPPDELEEARKEAAAAKKREQIISSRMTADERQAAREDKKRDPLVDKVLRQVRPEPGDFEPIMSSTAREDERKAFIEEMRVRAEANRPAREARQAARAAARPPVPPASKAAPKWMPWGPYEVQAEHFPSLRGMNPREAYESVNAAGAQGAPTAGIMRPRPGFEHLLPRTEMGQSYADYGAAKASYQRRFNNEYQMDPALARVRLGKVGYTSMMTERTPRGTAAVLGAISPFGGGISFKQRQELARQAQMQYGSLNTAYAADSGTARSKRFALAELRHQEQAAPGSVTADTMALAESEAKSSRALFRQTAKKRAAARTRMIETDKYAEPTKIDMARSFGSIILSTTAYGVAMSAVALIIEKAGLPALKALGDQLLGWQATASKTTTALAEQTTAANGNVKAVLAQTAAQAGMSKSMMAYVEKEAGATIIAKAAATAAGMTGGMFRTAMGSGAPKGLYGGYGGILDTGILGSEMGGGKGFTETYAAMLNGNGSILGDQAPSDTISAVSGYFSNARQRKFMDLQSRQAGHKTFGDIAGETILGGLAGGPAGAMSSMIGGFTYQGQPSGEGFESLGPYNANEGLNMKQIATRTLVAMDLNQAAGRAQDQLTTKGKAATKVTWGLAKSWEEVEKAAMIATVAGDLYSAQMAERYGIVMRVKQPGEEEAHIAGTTKEYQAGVLQTAKGKTIADVGTWASGFGRQMEGQMQALAIQAERQRSLSIPWEMTKQTLQQPLIQPGISFFPTSGAGTIGSGEIARAGMTGPAATMAGQFLGQATQAQGQIRTISGQGLARQIGEIGRNFPPFEAAFKTIQFGALAVQADSLSKAIANVTTEASKASQAANNLSWDNQIRIAERSMGDVLGMMGKVASADGKIHATKLGQLQREQYLNQRAGQRLGLELQQRSITTNLALAQFQAPGETGEERYFRQKEAIVKGGIEQQQLDISWKSFNIDGKIWVENLDRAGTDLEKTLKIMAASRNAEGLTATAQALAAENGKLLAQTIADMDTIVGESSGVFNVALSAATGGVEQFTGTIKDAIVEIYRSVGMKASYDSKGNLKFAASTGMPSATPGGSTGPGRGETAGPLRVTPTTVLGYTEVLLNRDLNKNNIIGAASGALFNTTRPTDLTVGEAKGETVAVLRNPRAASMNEFGGGNSNVTVNINGASVRNDNDISSLARQVAVEVERSLSRKGQMFGLRSPSV